MREIQKLRIPEFGKCAKFGKFAFPFFDRCGKIGKFEFPNLTGATKWGILNSRNLTKFPNLTGGFVQDRGGVIFDFFVNIITCAFLMGINRGGVRVKERRYQKNKSGG